MVGGEEGESISLLSLCEIACPLYNILLIFLIKYPSCMHIVLYYHLSSAILKEFIPSGLDVVGIFRSFIRANVHKEGRAHVYVVDGDDSKENKYNYGVYS
jgi:hypothetical protein